MMFHPIGIKHPLNVAVQGSHNADTRKHRRPSRRRDQDQRFHGRLPLRGLVLGLRQLRYVPAGILEGDKLANAAAGSARQNRRFQPRSTTGFDRLAQPLHGEFDVLRLQIALALDFGHVPIFREALKILEGECSGGVGLRARMNTSAATDASSAPPAPQSAVGKSGTRSGVNPCSASSSPAVAISANPTMSGRGQATQAIKVTIKKPRKCSVFQPSMGRSCQFAGPKAA
jgi:hypothetical protein